MRDYELERYFSLTYGGYKNSRTDSFLSRVSQNIKTKLTDHLGGIDIQLIRNDTRECTDKNHEEVVVAVEECIGANKENGYVGRMSGKMI